jgi:hypothetical protein
MVRRLAAAGAIALLAAACSSDREPSSFSPPPPSPCPQFVDQGGPPICSHFVSPEPTGTEGLDDSQGGGGPPQSSPSPGAPGLIARSSSSGPYALTITTGSAAAPQGVSVGVLASPNQRVSGIWVVVCTKELDVGSKQGNLSGRTPLSVAIPLPVHSPEDCTVTAEAQLSRSGRVTVRIFQS